MIYGGMLRKVKLQDKLRDIDKQDLIDILEIDSVDISAAWKMTKGRIECTVYLDRAVEDLKDSV